MLSEAIKLGIAAGELSRALSGAPSPMATQNAPLPIEWQSNTSSQWEKDPLPVTVFEQEFIPLGEVDMEHTKNAIGKLVNKDSEPDFWKLFDTRLETDPYAYFIVSPDSTRDDLFYTNRYTVAYYSQEPEAEATFPTVEIDLIDPDGIDYFDPTVIITLQLAKDRTLSGYKIDQDLPDIGSIPAEELETLGDRYFLIPEGMRELPFLPAEDDPENTKYRTFEDPASKVNYYQQISLIGSFISFGYSTPPPEPAQ